eukprot:PhM_4_TR9780/c0_g1_i1/m.11928
MATDFDHVKIAVREKPLSDEERDMVQVMLRTDNDKLIAYYPESKEGLLYNYDYFFPEDATQLDVFQMIGLEMVQRVMAGVSCSCLAFGPSNSGKTHTLFGSDRESGLIHLVCRELMTQMASEENADTHYTVQFSYWEMNNEEIRDALNPDNTRNLLVRKNEHQRKLFGGQGIYIPGLTVVDVSSWEELDAFIMRGNVHRIEMSEVRGARWHGFLKLFISSSSRSDGRLCTARTLTFVQLKGPDRVGQKGARGDVFRHGSSINKSISILGSAILHSVELRRQAIKRQLAEGKDPDKIQKDLPKVTASAFQESKLSQVLTSALSGAEATFFIGTVCALDYHEATDTLENLQNAQQITCNVPVHRYKTNVGALKDELAAAEAQMPQSDLAEGHPLSEIEEHVVKLRDKYDTAITGGERPDTPPPGPSQGIAPVEVDPKLQLWKHRTVKAKLHGDRATVYIPAGKGGKNHTYKGQWAHGRREGFGEYLTDTVKYVGEWAGGMKDGEGTLWVRAKKTDEWRRVYRGAWQQDMRHGRGVNWYENGEVYEGYFDRNQRSAIGKLFLVNGDRIEGQWKSDKVEGWATLYMKSGDWFEGHWVAGLREGPGTWVYETKQQMMRGEWHKGISRCGTMEDLPKKQTNDKSAFLSRCQLQRPEDVLKQQVRRWEEIRREDLGVDWEEEARRAEAEAFEGVDDEDVTEGDLAGPTENADGEEVSW